MGFPPEFCQDCNNQFGEYRAKGWGRGKNGSYK